MTPSKPVTTSLVVFLAITIPRVVIGQQQPYFFNYQPQQQQQPQYQQQQTYQPFNNPPPPPQNFFQPSFQSQANSGGPELLGNFFNDAFTSAPTGPPSNHLVQYPTQVTTLDGTRHHLQPQPFQPVGNSLQQAPTVPTTTTTAFRPSPFLNHHTHIVDGLPRRQFFGNNYAFFRDSHGLGLPPTPSPFLQTVIQNQNAAAPNNQPAPTPSAPAQATASPAPTSATSPKPVESKPNPTVKTLALDRPSSPSPPLTTQSTFLSRFPFPGPSTFSPVSSQQSYKPVAPATTPAPKFFPAAQSTTFKPAISPSFNFQQYFPETGNDLPRQPLFQEDSEEGFDDDNFTLNNNFKQTNNQNNINYFSNQGRQVSQPRPQQSVTVVPPTQTYKITQQSSGNTGSFNNGLASPAKDEPAPARVHSTTPIRIVFNYEQAIEALEETPGVRVVIAHTEKNNLTENESSTIPKPITVNVPPPTYATTPRSYSPQPTYATTPRSYSPQPTYATTPRAYSPQPTYQYQTTTQRPANYVTYRPLPEVNSNYRPGPEISNYRPATEVNYRPAPTPTVSTNYRPVQPVTSTYSPAPVVSSTYRPAPPVTSTYRPAPVVSSTYRPVVQTTTTTTPRPTFYTPTQRYQYQPVQNQYNSEDFEDDRINTGGALENLALELEGRLENTERPQYFSQQRPLYQPAATFPPATTESPLKTYQRGGKKYLVVPSVGEKVYRGEEPRVVVNDLANIVVQPVQPGGHYTATHPSTFPRQSFRAPISEVSQEVDEDVSDEIDHLNQQIQQEYQTTTTTTTTTPRPRPPQTTPQPRLRPSPTPRLLRITTYRPPFTSVSTYRPPVTTTTTTTPPPPPSPSVVPEDISEDTVPEVNNQLNSEPPSLTARRQPESQVPKYYYNNKQVNGLSGAHQRYEYSGGAVVNPSAPSPPEQRKKIRRRPRPKGRLIAGSPPRPVQVGPGGLGPIVSDGLPPPLPFGPVGPGVPLGVAPGSPLAPLPGGPVPAQAPVFRVGPRGRLLRRKTRPRAQLQGQQPSPVPSFAPSASPSAVPDLPPVPQGIGSPLGPSQLPPLYSPTPFIPEDVPLVTTFRPRPPPVLVQQSVANEDEERKAERPNAFRNRFRFNPNGPSSSAEETESSQNESEEEAVVPQRRRFQSTTTTTEKPEEARAPVASDRANILQRQIRFNKNRKNHKNRQDS